MKPGFYLVRPELMPVHSRGQESPNSNHFIKAHLFTAIGAISINKILALRTINNLINKAAFVVFIVNFLCPNLWAVAVVLMIIDLHKLASIVPMIEAVGASGIYLSHTLAYFNPIEKWLSPLNSFLLWFAPTTTSVIDTIIAVSLNKHEYSTFKKLGKLIADIVPHNSRNCCNCYQTPSAKTKST